MSAKTMIKSLALALGVAAATHAFAEGEWAVATFSDGATTVNLDMTNALGEAYLDADSLDAAIQAAYPAESLATLGWPKEIKFNPTAGLAVDTIEIGGSSDVLIWADYGINHQGSGSEYGDPLQYATRHVLLTTRGKASMFTVTTSAAVTFKGLMFKGAGDSSSSLIGETALPYDGGAIHAKGGSLEIHACTFSNLVTRFSGGAVCAERMDGGVVVSNSVFYGNASSPLTGNGGALYASRVRGGSGKCVINNCRFEANEAANGGAVSTLTVIADDEEPIDLEVASASTPSGGGTTTKFVANVARSSGGAIIAEGALFSTNGTWFTHNHASLLGGAVCLTGVKGKCAPKSATFYSGRFEGNVVESTTNWVAGGAIAIMPAAYTLNVYGGLVFTTNAAISKGKQALGGAIYTDDGATNYIYKGNFRGNVAKDLDSKMCYGDAVSVSGGKTTLSTCIFNCTNTTARSFGNGVDADGVELSVINSSFRFGAVEAISSYNGSLAVTNCVIVGNNLGGASGDVYYDASSASKFSIDYSAYGKMMVNKAKVAVTLGEHNLTNQNTSIYSTYSSYVPDLKLNGARTTTELPCYNPVAALGLPQSDVEDYNGKLYGSFALGSSMGAWETPATNMTVVVDGTRKYKQGDTTSSGCTWAYSSFTNVNKTTSAIADFDWPVNDVGVALENAYTVTNWAFSSDAVGYYASTNDVNTIVDGAVTSNNARVEWFSTIVDFIYTGTIEQNTNKVWVVIIPPEYKWTGEEIIPGETSDPKGQIIVSNTVDETVLPVDGEYMIEVTANVDPTNAAVVTVTGTNNYDFTETATFFITAYLTKIYTNGNVLVSVSTNGSLSTTNECIPNAMTSPFPGYCLDYQNSTTNKAVEQFNPNADDHNTTLTAIYEVDANGNGIPDKYEKQIIVAVVNGEWDGSSNAYDRVVYALMTNNTGLVYEKADGTKEGLWTTNAADGVCSLDSTMFPTAGANPWAGMKNAGVWYNVDGTTFASGSTIGWTSFPIYYYLYAQADLPRDGGEHGSYGTMALDDDASPFTVAVQMTDFEVGEDGGIAGAVDMQLWMKPESGAAKQMVKALTPGGVAIEVWGAETLDGEWRKVADVTTNGDGTFEIGGRVRDRSAVSASADGKGNWNTSDIFDPKFYKVELAK